METFAYGEILSDNKDGNDHMAISKYFNEYSLKPYFYKKDDMAVFRTILERIKGQNTLSVAENLFTLVPRIDIEPVPSKFRTRYADDYGFFTMSASQFLVRPDVENVLSCHSLRDHSDTHALAGNLSYIQDPHWSCVGVYKKTGKPGYIRSACMLGFADNELENMVGMPPLVATFNVAMLFDTDGYMYLGISRIYGDENIPLDRFIEYVVRKLNLRVVFIANSTTSYSTYKSGRNVDIDASTVNGATFYTIPVCPQIYSTRFTGERFLVSRYSDIRVRQVVPSEDFKLRRYFKPYKTFEVLLGTRVERVGCLNVRDVGEYSYAIRTLVRNVLCDIPVNDDTGVEMTNLKRTEPCCVRCGSTKGIFSYGAWSNRSGNSLICKDCHSRLNWCSISLCYFDNYDTNTFLVDPDGNTIEVASSVRYSLGNLYPMEYVRTNDWGGKYTISIPVSVDTLSEAALLHWPAQITPSELIAELLLSVDDQVEGLEMNDDLLELTPCEDEDDLVVVD